MSQPLQPVGVKSVSQRSVRDQKEVRKRSERGQKEARQRSEIAVVLDGLRWS